MLTIIKNWLETHSIRSGVMLARKQQRDARRELRNMTKEHKTAAKIDALIKDALESNKVVYQDDMFRAYDSYANVMTDEIEDIEDIIMRHKQIMSKHLAKIEELKENIRNDKDDNRKKELIATISTMEEKLLKDVKTLFENLTSFQNTTYSTGWLIDKSSKLRETFYSTKMTKKDEKGFDRAIEKADKEERSGGDEDAKKNATAALNELNQVISHQTTLLTYCFLLLQQISSDLNKKMKFIDENLVAKDPEHPQYPQLWAKSHKEVLQKIYIDLIKWITKEIEENRIWLSDTARAKG